MNVKEIDNQNARRAHATRDNPYKIQTNKYIEHDSRKQITISVREKGTDKYKNAHIEVVAIELIRSRDRVGLCKRKTKPCVMLRSWFEIFRYIDLTNKC